MKDPKVIDPPEFDLKKAWSECDGDPGVCSCPICDEYYCSFGNVIECECGFQFPVDWWHQYSKGVQDGTRVKDGGSVSGGMRIRENNPYYRHGFQNPVEDAWKRHNQIDWAAFTAGWDPRSALSHMEEFAICERCGKKKEGQREKRSGLCIKCESETECKHRCSLMEKKCKAGVVFDELAGTEPGKMYRLPCFYNAGGQPVHCDKFEPVSVEDCEAEDEAMKAALQRMMITMPLITEVKGEHKGEDWKGEKPCPICDGTLHMTHAAVNGHVWGQCETKGCLSWME